MSIDTEKKISFITTQILKLVAGLMMMLISVSAWLAITVFNDIKESVMRMEINVKESIEKVEVKIKKVSEDVTDIKVSFSAVEERVHRNAEDIREIKEKN